MDFAQEMLTTFNDDPGFLKKLITGDESFAYGYDIESCRGLVGSVLAY